MKRKSEHKSKGLLRIAPTFLGHTVLNSVDLNVKPNAKNCNHTVPVPALGSCCCTLMQAFVLPALAKRLARHAIHVHHAPERLFQLSRFLTKSCFCVQQQGQNGTSYGQLDSTKCRYVCQHF